MPDSQNTVVACSPPGLSGCSGNTSLGGGRGKPIGVDALKIRDDRLVCVDMANSLDFDHDDERCGEDKKWFAA